MNRRTVPIVGALATAALLINVAGVASADASADLRVLQSSMGIPAVADSEDQARGSSLRSSTRKSQVWACASTPATKTSTGPGRG
jgi:hypothetical protein